MAAPNYSPVSGLGTRVNSGGRVYQFQGNGQWIDVGPASTSTRQVNYTPINSQPSQRSTPVPQTSTSPSGGATSLRDQMTRGLIPWDDNLLAQQNQGSSDASEEARRYEEETRNQINSGYGAYETGLKGIQDSYESGEQDELSSAANIYQQIFGGLTDQKTANLQKLEANRGGVQTRQAQSIRDLQQNLSNVSRNMGMQLGAMGAGDTSAARVMAPYAYTKLAGAEEGKIRRQANDQLFQIEQQEKDTDLEFSKMWRQTETDKESQLQGIRNYYGDAIRNVQMALAQAPLDKAKDLAALNQSLLAEAQANLRQLESENRQRLDTIKNWATQRMTELNNLKLQLSGTANFQPQDIIYNELQMQGVAPRGQASEGFYNPMLLASKKRQEYLG